MPNSILSSLPAELAEALPIRTKELKLGDIVARRGQPFEFCYFPISCMLSEVVQLEEGGTVEAAIIGNNGFLGIPLLFGQNISATTVTTQIAGEAAFMSVEYFSELLAIPGAAIALGAYARHTFEQMAQSAACLAFHPIASRLARWLLMASDVIDREVLPLTHEFLANMLGTHRPTVTVAVGSLENAGLIELRRAAIRILDREKLEEASCECYRALKQTQEA